MTKKNKIYLTIEELMDRWQCKKTFAYEFAHRRGSGAIKPAGKILIPLKEVEERELSCAVRTG